MGQYKTCVIALPYDLAKFVSNEHICKIYSDYTNERDESFDWHECGIIPLLRKWTKIGKEQSRSNASFSSINLLY